VPQSSAGEPVSLSPGQDDITERIYKIALSDGVVIGVLIIVIVLSFLFA